MYINIIGAKIIVPKTAFKDIKYAAMKTKSIVKSAKLRATGMNNLCSEGIKTVAATVTPIPVTSAANPVLLVNKEKIFPIMSVKKPRNETFSIFNIELNKIDPNEHPEPELQI